MITHYRFQIAGLFSLWNFAFTYFSHNYSRFRDVPGCSGMFHVHGFIDEPLYYIYWIKSIETLPETSKNNFTEVHSKQQFKFSLLNRRTQAKARDTISERGAVSRAQSANKARIKKEKKSIVSRYVLVLKLCACSTWSPVARAIVVKKLLARKGELRDILNWHLLISSSSDIKLSLPGRTDRVNSVEKECERKIQ